LYTYKSFLYFLNSSSNALYLNFNYGSNILTDNGNPAANPIVTHIVSYRYLFKC